MAGLATKKSSDTITPLILDGKMAVTTELPLKFPWYYTDKEYTDETLRNVTGAKSLTTTKGVITFTVIIQNLDSRPILTYPGTLFKK